MMNAENKMLKVMVICNDGRSDAWINLLRSQVSDLYMLKAGRCRKFTPDDPEGLAIPHSQLPKTVNALLFHSSDMKLWENIQVEADYTFEFNTPGTPQPKPGVIPIYRQTFPYFAIKPSDVDELLAFIVTPQQAYPTICQPVLTPDLLSALATLCQGYLVMENNPSIKVCTQPSWWLEGIGLLQQGKLDQYACQEMLMCLKEEWTITKKPDASHDGLDRLLANLLIKQSDSYKVISRSVSSQVVVDAYGNLREALGICIQSDATCMAKFEDYTSGKVPVSIFAIRGSFLATATAIVLAMRSSTERHLLELGAVDALPNTFYKSTLVVAESQVTCLPTLRSQGFSGAILVLSTETFPVLKQKYRVLRFGQGSHDALTIPFTLADLHSKANNLVPIEQENLRLFQNELKAFKHLYEREIIPCLQRLEQPGTDLKLATEEVAIIVEKMKAETPVACHSVITIEDETLQIQHHLRKALHRLERQESLNSTVCYLKAIFEQWYKLVRSAAGENLKLAS